MKIFEERCVDEYLREKNALLRATQEEQIRVLNDRYNQPELCFYLHFLSVRSINSWLFLQNFIGRSVEQKKKQMLFIGCTLINFENMALDTKNKLSSQWWTIAFFFVSFCLCLFVFVAFFVLSRHIYLLKEFQTSQKMFTSI